MKALLLSAYNDLQVTEMTRPEPGADEVLVEVAACGICGSDVHGYDGSSGRRIPPIVMGHEAAGIVAGMGPDVRGLAIGDPRYVRFERSTAGSAAFAGSARSISAIAAR